MIQFKDVAHIYLGCKMVALQNAEEIGYAEIDFNKGDIGILSLVNIGSAQILCDESDNYPYVVDLKGCYACFHSLQEFKPILRPLSSMTEEEMKECGNLDYDFSEDNGENGTMNLNEWHWSFFDTLITSNQFTWLLRHGFDLHGLIESGQAIEKEDKQQTIW